MKSSTSMGLLGGIVIGVVANIVFYIYRTFVCQGFECVSDVIGLAFLFPFFLLAGLILGFVITKSIGDRDIDALRMRLSAGKKEKK